MQYPMQHRASLGALFFTLTTSLILTTRLAAQDVAPNRSAVVDELRGFVDQGLEAWQVPGLAIAIVERAGEGDKVLLAEGFGVRQLGQTQPVTDTTAFSIYSATKPFTGTALGVLVSEGRLDWDAKVLDILPWFRLADDHATTHVTVRDLLTHRSGLSTQPYVWYGSQLTRRQLIERARHLPMSADLRQRFQYQNLMYTTAGYLGGVVDESSWEDLVRSRLFEPLGMTRSFFSIEDVIGSGDYAKPHGRPVGELEAVDFFDASAVGPAGGIYSSAQDLARWLRFNLGDGTFEGRKVLETSVLREIQSPQTVLSSEGDGPEIPYFLYGLGWNIYTYRGHRVLHHAGGAPGFNAQVAVLPDDGLGVALVANRRTSFTSVLLSTALDRLLGLESIDWTERNARQLKRETGAPRTRVGPGAEPGPVHAHPLATYAGEYEDAGYGPVSITFVSEGGEDDGELRLTYNEMSAPLHHEGFETFSTAGNEAISGIPVQFVTDLSGEVAHLAIPFAPGVPPIVFLKR